jgi:tetratricopeptide (TPR) repeat protein
MRLAAPLSLGLDMPGKITFVGIAICCAICPLSEAFACSWDNLGVGYPAECGYRPPGGGGGGGGGYAPPVYRAPPVYQPSPTELKQRQSVAFNQQGLAQFNHKNYEAAIKLFQTAARLATTAKSVQINRQNIGNAYSWLGKAAFERGDTADALRLYELAAQYYPDNKVYKEAVTTLRERIIGSQSSTRIVKSLSETIAAAPASGGLDIGSFEAKNTSKPPALGFGSFGSGNSQSNSGLKDAVADTPSDEKTARGTFGTKIAKPVLLPVEGSGHAGTDTKAGDQLMSAAATAKANGDLTPNFDGGTAKSAGSLPDARHYPIDLSKFSERAKNDSLIVSTMKELDALKIKRDQLTTERDALIRNRNAAPDKATMNRIDEQMRKKDAEYRDAVGTIFKKEEIVEARHRVVDATVAGTTDKKDGNEQADGNAQGDHK